MYTDGGSIPKIAQVFNGLSPWGYAPAYMVHDWLFTARQCHTDNPADKRFTWIAAVPFSEPAKILGEAIKALIASKQVQEKDVAPSAITWAVTTPVAEKSWNAHGACKLPDIGAADLLAIDHALPRSAQIAASTRAQLEASTSQGRKASHAVIVSRVNF